MNWISVSLAYFWTTKSKFYGFKYFFFLEDSEPIVIFLMTFAVNCSQMERN